MSTKYVRITGILMLMLLAVVLAAASYNRLRGDDSRKSSEAKKQYVCSMHPQVLTDLPGDCPICGMFLIEKIDNDKNRFDSSLIDIARPVNELVMGAPRTVMPVLESVPVYIEAPGIVNYDPRKIQTIGARFGGVVERSFVRYQFQRIKKGQKIFEIYCPDIYTERWNYVKLVQAYPDRDDISREALEWFRYLGLSEGQIDSLKHSVRPDYHLAVYSSAEGYAVSNDFDPETFFLFQSDEAENPETFLAGSGTIALRDGVTIEKGESLFKLIDITSLRIDLKVKTEECTLVKGGQEVMIADAANPEKKIKAKVSQIDPLNGGLFQSVKVYVTDNESLLIPGRQINAEIFTGNHSGLWLPSSSVIEMGHHSSVFIMDGGKFISAEVKTGIKTRDRIEILWGVSQNSIVAEKALLLVDSDSFISLK